MSLLHIFLVAGNKQESHGYSYSKAWGNALSAYPLSFIIFVFNFPFFIFTSFMLIYHTYLSMIDCTTYESIKNIYAGKTFTPHSSGSMLKNYFRRIFEKTPPSMLTMELRKRDKISLNSTKAGLEREFDIKKTVLEVEDEEMKLQQAEIRRRRQELFKKQIMRPEPEKRVELSEDFPDGSSQLDDGHDSSEDVSNIEEGQDSSLYDKIKQKKYSIQFKNPSSNDNDLFQKKIRKSMSGSSSSSFLKSNQDKGSVNTFNQDKLLKGLEQSEIAKKGGMDSEVTSTIRGAFNQINSIVEAQQFHFNQRNRIIKNRSFQHSN